MLLDEEKWRRLIEECDYSLFIEADECILKKRLVDRKIQGGLGEEKAKAFYERSDKINIQRVLNNRLEADLQLSMLETGEKIITTT